MPLGYYLYRHIRNDKNQPFYIGVGQNFRSKNDFRRAFEKHTHNKIWSSIYKKTSYCVEILYTTNTRQEILSKEVEFIKLYGRIDVGNGTLANLTNGGEGHRGLNAATRQKMKERMIGNKYMVGKKLSEDTKLKMSQSRMGRIPSKKAIEILNKRNKGNKYGKLNLGKKHKQETIKYLSIIKKGKPTYQSYPILCINNNKIYKMLGDCASDLFDNINAARMGIKRVLDGRYEIYNGFKFKYI